MTQDLRSFLAEIDDVLLSRRSRTSPGWRICDLLFRNLATQARVLRTTPDQVLPELAPP